jgi:hypothetical protein
MMTGLPWYWLSETGRPGWSREDSENPWAAGYWRGAAVVVARLTAITAAANSTTTAEITLCLPSRRLVLVIADVVAFIRLELPLALADTGHSTECAGLSGYPEAT